MDTRYSIHGYWIQYPWILATLSADTRWILDSIHGYWLQYKIHVMIRQYRWQTLLFWVKISALKFLRFFIPRIWPNRFFPQILSGIYPIAQVREPYSSVEYLARRVPLPKLLRLRHPDDEGQQHEQRRTDLPWSAMDICYGTKTHFPPIYDSNFWGERNTF